MFRVHYLETEFLQTVWKLTERISSLGTTIELFHFTFRRCTFMNCSSQTRNSPCLLSIFISFRAYDAPRPFWNLHRDSCCGYLYTYRFTFYATLFADYPCSREIWRRTARCVQLSSRCSAFTCVLESSRSFDFVFEFGEFNTKIVFNYQSIHVFAV